MFCHLGIAGVLYNAWYRKKSYARRPHTRKYSENINGVAIILATVAIRYALDNWSSGMYLKKNFEGGTFKGESEFINVRANVSVRVIVRVERMCRSQSQSQSQ